jgi:predicted RNA-binding protein
MCLSTVYELGEGGNRIKLSDHITFLRVLGDRITMEDIMGEELSFLGGLVSVDLIKNAIVVSRSPSRGISGEYPEAVFAPVSAGAASQA